MHEITSHQPTVSVLLPNLNSRQFLQERLQTILDQTFQDWELVVVDNYSDDGAWELFQAFATQDARIRISQAPREGMYVNWNNCIRLARGKYIYIATSDDTMTPDCLEKMVTALEAYPECDVCHTCLRIIDEHGEEIDNWWQFESTQFYGDLIHKRHIRKAPFDGMLHCALHMIYCSLTQLLIRRSVFEKVGLFPTARGSIGDFEWDMRVGLTCHVLHLPETLATWRRHSQQATQSDFLRTAQYYASLCEMITAALPYLQAAHPAFYNNIRVSRLLMPYRQAQCIIGMGAQQGWRSKIAYLSQMSLISPRNAVAFVLRRLMGNLRYLDRTAYIRQELERLGISFDEYVELI
ncbi:glycosyltransferase [candidate division KSB3 bacterium]|uniref:Glycosyltransferase n=1 Tax=candidate division KSB3 bacterium TaxID=2044937 RepID=A0A9D5JTQ2_9BACT|nr:glycosyltransferase [candidate division KSB3 bacterium]MBD3324005.1 glycosyltransferase [candidate division KSB3 bacterium]